MGRGQKWTLGECTSLSGLFPSVSTCNRKSTLKCCHVASAHTHTAPSQPYTIPQPLLPELAMVKSRKLTIVVRLSKHRHTSSSHHRHHYTYNGHGHGEGKINLLWSICFTSEPEEKTVRGFNWGRKARESLCRKARKRSPLGLAFTWSCGHQWGRESTALGLG